MNAAERIAVSRCVSCNQQVCDAWVCVGCSIASRFEALRTGDPMAPSPSRCGRSLQERVDRSAAYEQVSQLWSVLDPGVQSIDEGRSKRKGELAGMSAKVISAKTRRALRAA
jgi:hypothetical protein